MQIFGTDTDRPTTRFLPVKQSFFADRFARQRGEGRTEPDRTVLNNKQVASWERMAKPPWLFTTLTWGWLPRTCGYGHAYMKNSAPSYLLTFHCSRLGSPTLHSLPPRPPTWFSAKKVVSPKLVLPKVEPAVSDTSRSEKPMVVVADAAAAAAAAHKEAAAPGLFGAPAERPSGEGMRRDGVDEAGAGAGFVVAAGEEQV